MNHTILFIFAFIVIVFAKPSTRSPGSSSEEEAKHKGPSKHQDSSTTQSITSSGAEDVSASSDVTTKAADVIIQKKEVAIVLAEVPDAKERRSVKDGSTQQPEDSTDVPGSSSPVFVAVVAKEISAVTVDSSADGKDSSAVAKKDGVIVA